MRYFPALILIVAILGHAPAGAESRLAASALERTEVAVVYDGRYRRIAYPNGDVPDDIGVCTDLVVRAYRAIGIDLQQLVHEDMRRDFAAYPPRWGLSRPDPNIDHRRVPNLEVFFRRNGETLPVSRQETAYRPGDIVAWRLSSGLPHIGIVANEKVEGSDRHRVIHNIGAGPRSEDVLFAYEIVGHYRYP